MQDTYNELSSEELKLISDADFFRMKNEITNKIKGNFAILGENISEILQSHIDQIPQGILKTTPKISQGERYLELPWLIIDFPRVFSDQDVFAFRSMFWWGNYFSFTIHLAGKYLEPVKRKLSDNISMLQGKGFYLCINKDQWQHHFEESNYRLLDELKPEEIKAIFINATFIKMGRKLALNSYPKMIGYGTETYKQVIEMLR